MMTDLSVHEPCTSVSYRPSFLCQMVSMLSRFLSVFQWCSKLSQAFIPGTNPQISRGLEASSPLHSPSQVPDAWWCLGVRQLQLVQGMS